MTALTRLGSLLLGLTVTYTAFGQESRSTIDMANTAYGQHEYLRAARLFEKVVTFHTFPPDAPSKLAWCYMEMNDFTSAVKWYKQITYHAPLDGVDWIHYGDALKSLGQYPEAKIAYGHTPDSLYNTIAYRVAGCDSALSWMKTPTGYKVSNLAAVNTSYSDWGAVWYAPHSVVFTSDSLRSAALDKDSKVSRDKYRRTGRSFQKIYVADSTEKGIGAVKGFSPVMNYNMYHDGPVAFTSDGDTAYFTLTNPEKINDPGDKEKIRLRKKVIDVGVRRLELFMCTRDSSGKWGTAVPVPFDRTNQYSIGHAALSADGRILYFTSDMPGGYGKTDIWYVERRLNGDWSSPVNCGPLINTADEEGFPSVGADGIFYFASKGHVGMGGYDIFKATGSGNTWQGLHNLQYPVNSPGDDFYFTSKDSVSGFLSSDRAGGKGSDDIYMYMLAPGMPLFRVIILRTQVIDRLSGNPVPDARVVLTNIQRDARWTDFTDSDGLRYHVLEGNAHYTDSAFKEGYRGDAATVSTERVKGSDTLSIRLYLSKNPTEGDVFILKNLYYDFDKSNIRPDAALVLDQLVTYMNQYPHMIIFFSSHTDSRGNDRYNMALSERRAQSAKLYLLKHGIDPERLQVKGFGESRPVNGCTNGVPCTPAQHQANRRTEIKVLHP